MDDRWVRVMVHQHFFLYVFSGGWCLAIAQFINRLCSSTIPNPRRSTFQLWPLPLSGRALALGEYGGLGFPVEAHGRDCLFSIMDLGHFDVKYFDDHWSSYVTLVSRISCNHNVGKIVIWTSMNRICGISGQKPPFEKHCRLSCPGPRVVARDFLGLWDTWKMGNLRSWKDMTCLEFLAMSSSYGGQCKQKEAIGYRYISLMYSLILGHQNRGTSAWVQRCALQQVSARVSWMMCVWVRRWAKNAATANK